ncbi:restriction endonuclease subunit S [Escherichia coli]
MSEMSYLEKLLDGVEVEWKTLGQTCKIETGKLNANAAVDDGEYMFFTTAKETSKIDKFRWDTEALLIAGNANVGEVKHYIGKFEAYQRTYVLTNFDENVSVRFLYFVLSHSLKKYLEERTNSAAMTYIVLSTLENFPIPIPCPDNPEKSLAIQSEIVRILDKFTALTAELTAELSMRKKQYNYYRDQLLNLDGRENTREMRIGDIYDFQYGTGNTIPKSGGQYPVYGSNGIVGSHDKYNSEDSPVIGHIGAYAGIVNWGQGKHFVTYNGVICRHKSKEVLQKYAYYLLLLQDFGSKSNSASQPFVSYNILNAPIVLVPPLQEQARIVAILDKFDTLTNSITEGLPREIELRQKQYEYYRDLLFSFPKPETVSN